MNKRKWTWLLILVFAALIALTVIFWDVIVMVIAPKAVLSASIKDIFNKLDARFSDSPLWLISAGYDESGSNTIQMDLDTFNEMVGDIHYDMTVQTDMINHLMTAEGVVEAKDNPLDMSLFLNTDFAALSSDTLLQGGYYGVTYETFVQDIRSFPLISFLIPDSTIRQWDESLGKLQSFMSRSVYLPQLPDFSKEDVGMLMLGVLALNSDVETKTISANGQALKCYKITYSETGDQVRELLGYVIDTSQGEDAKIEMSFYLYNKSIIQVDMTAAAGSHSINGQIFLGMDAETEDISLALTNMEKGREENYSAIVKTRQENGRYMETIVLNDIAISYDWNPESGDMKLYLPEREPVALNLSKAENGFQIKTEELMELLNLDSQAQYDCTMIVSKGSSITVPSYKNLDRWSFSDLIVLLNGVGSVLGFHTQ